MLFNVVSLLPGPQTFKTVSYPIATGEPVVIATYKAPHRNKLTKTPPPPPKPVYGAYSSKKQYSADHNVALIRKLTREAGYTPKQVEIWVKIAFYESGWNNTASNRGRYNGLYQIWTGHNCKNVFDPASNIRCAIKIQRASGFVQPWQVCRTRMRCV